MVILVKGIKLCTILLIAIVVASFAPQHLSGVPDASPQYDAPQFGYKRDMYTMIPRDDHNDYQPDKCRKQVISNNRTIEICTGNRVDLISGH